MRTKQGTLRGYSDDGFRIGRNCRGFESLDEVPPDCPSIAGEELTPREAKRGMAILIAAGLLPWLGKHQKQLCPACAKALSDHFDRLDAEVEEEIRNGSRTQQRIYLEIANQMVVAARRF